MRKDWEIKKLGEVCTIGDGNYSSKYPKASEFTSDGVPFLTATNLKNGAIIPDGIRFISKEQHSTLTKGHVIKNDLVIVVRGSSTGNNSIVSKEYEGSNLNSQLAFLRIKNNKLDSKYLFSVFNSPDVQKVVLNTISGAAQPQLPNNKLLNIEIPIPPLSEQQHIVSILDEAFAAITKVKTNAEKNLQNAKDLFESYLHAVFANPGDGWLTESLESLLEKGWILSHLDGNHGGDYPKKEEFQNEGVPYISANCIKGTDVDFSLSKFLTPKRALTIRKGVAINNDVLFAHNATVGPVAILKTKEPKVILGTSLTYYRCNTDYILPVYLASYMRSKEFKSQYEIIMRQSTRNQVPITKQREFYHIIPPIDFQKQLVIQLESLLSNTQKLETIYQQKLNDLEELKKSILQKAFSGELTTKKELA